MKKIIALLTLIGVVALGSVVPTNWISGYVYTNNTVQITNTTFTANGAAAADLVATNGDIREVSMALLEEMYDSQVALGTNAPTYMVIQKDMKIDTSDQLITVYVFTYTSDISTSDIVSE